MCFRPYGIERNVGICGINTACVVACSRAVGFRVPVFEIISRTARLCRRKGEITALSLCLSRRCITAAVGVVLNLVGFDYGIAILIVL